MSAATVDWLPGLIALGVGLLAGALVVWRVLRGSGHAAATKGVPAEEPALELRDLAARRDVLMAQLREMEDTGAKRSPEQLARERYALELETAEVLRRLEGAAAAPAAMPAPPPSVAPTPGPAPGGRPALTGFLWGTGTAGALGLLLFFVSQAARPRQDGATATGNTPMEGRGAAPAAADPEEAQIRAALERNPDDLEARLELARHHLAQRDMMGVWNETQFVLAKSPGDPRALTYQSLVRLAMGQADLALKMVQEAVAKAPDLLEAYVHMTLIYVRMGKQKEAEATIADASRRFPDQAQMLGRLLEEMRTTEPEAEASPSDHADPHAGIPPPGETATGSSPAVAPRAAAPPAPAAAGAAPSDAEAGRKVAGTIDLDPSLRSQVPAGAIVFVTVREAGFGAGPPMAAKRIPASFPLRFEIGVGDSMMGQPLPAEMLIEARLDADGDPMSRSKADPSDRRDDVKAGTMDLNLVLRKP